MGDCSGTLLLDYLKIFLLDGYLADLLDGYLGYLAGLLAAPASSAGTGRAPVGVLELQLTGNERAFGYLKKNGSK